ncbi:MAG TPA: hypothetical protein PLQ11_08100 [Beijerinckiaceae bacterium]|nr:hypothetical protein [Beijerinckiaceae bacterium]
MATLPISREKQIELMRTAAERQEARTRVWKSDPLVKRVMSEPAPGQEKTAYQRVPLKKLG